MKVNFVHFSFTQILEVTEGTIDKMAAYLWQKSMIIHESILPLDREPRSG